MRCYFNKYLVIVNNMLTWRHILTNKYRPVAQYTEIQTDLISRVVIYFL